MRKMRFMTEVVWLLISVAAVSYAAEPVRGPQLSRERYQTVVANLDTGGDLLVVANVEGYLQELIGDISQMIALAPSSGGAPNEAQAFMSKLPGFLQKNGFYAVQGIGLSAVPRADGLNTVKWFVSRDTSAEALPLWRATVGGAPRVLAGADFLPADTVIADTGTGELKELWKMIRAGVAELTSPETAANFDKSVSSLSTNMGIDMDKVFGSLGGEGFFSIQLSRTATVDIPSSTGGGAVKIPQPSLLIGLAVKDDALLKAIEAPLKRGNLPVMKAQAESVEVSTLNLPLPVPFPIQPSYAICSNFFLLGSTSQVVADAIKAFKEKNALVASPEFKRAFEGLPTTNNGIFYMSPRLMKTVIDLQVAMARSGSNGVADSPLRSILARRGDVQSAFVTQNLKTGILTTGTSSSRGGEIVGSVMVAPIGFMAAIAIPSFVKARTTAQKNACINNLRMIDAAKEQWALAERKADGDPVDIPGISRYIRGAKLPVCPCGGAYTVNGIGRNPECSIPDHALPQFPR